MDIEYRDTYGVDWTNENKETFLNIIIDRKSLEFTRLLFIAGAVGGVCAKMLISPIEVMVSAHTADLCIRSKIKREGLKIFKVNPYNYVRMVPFAGTLCVTYGQLSSRLPTEGVAWHARLLAGCAAGGIATIMTHPLDVLNGRLSTNVSSSLQPLSVKVLFRGIGPSFIAMSVSAGVQQYVFDCCRSSLASRSDGRGPISHFIISGAVAGVISQTIVHPLTLLSTMKGNQFTASHILSRHSGFRSLYAGLLPTYSKAIPAVAVTLTVRDTVLGRVEWARDS